MGSLSEGVHSDGLNKRVKEEGVVAAVCSCSFILCSVSPLTFLCTKPSFVFVFFLPPLLSHLLFNLPSPRTDSKHVLRVLPVTV